MTGKQTTAEQAFLAMQATAEAWALRKFAEKLSNRIPDGSPTDEYEDVISVIEELREASRQKKMEAGQHRTSRDNPGTSSTPAYDALLTLCGPEPSPELITAIAQRDGEVLRTAADKLDALPAGGEALKGPVWYREGIHDAAGLCRDWADHADNMDGFLGPIKYDLLVELRRLRNFQEQVEGELARIKSEAKTPQEILLADVMAKRLGVESDQASTERAQAALRAILTAPDRPTHCHDQPAIWDGGGTCAYCTAIQHAQTLIHRHDKETS